MRIAVTISCHDKIFSHQQHMQRYKIDYQKIGGDSCDNVEGFFKVSVGPETVFYIDGIPQKTVYMKEGLCYKFVIENTGNHPFYITQSSIGEGEGYDSKIMGNLQPTTNGSMYFTFKKSDQPLFYQCYNHPHMGGPIIIT